MKLFNCAEITLDLHTWGEENDLNSNWNMIKNAACFTHKEACEFIIHIGSEEFRTDHALNPEIQVICNDALKLGFNYICFVG